MPGICRRGKSRGSYLRTGRVRRRFFDVIMVCSKEGTGIQGAVCLVVLREQLKKGLSYMPSITNNKDLIPGWNPWNKTGASASSPPTVLKWVLVVWLLACVWNEVCYSNEVHLREQRKALPTTAGQVVQVKRKHDQRFSFGQSRLFLHG